MDVEVEEEERKEKEAEEEEEQEKELEEEEQEEKQGEVQKEEEKGVEEDIVEEEKEEEKGEEALEEEQEEELEVEELEEEEHQAPPRKHKLVEEEHKERKHTHPEVIDMDKEMEAEEIKTKPHKQPVVCQYSAGNTKEQHKEAARLLVLPDLELETKIHTLPNFQSLQSNPNIISASLQVTHNNQAIHQQKEQLNCIDPSTLHCTWVQPTSCHLDVWNCTIFEAVNCNHRVVVWNLIEHWQWENVYEVVPAAAGMELSWIILNHISGFENYINSKTLEGHAAPKPTTLQKYSTTLRALFHAPGVVDLIKELNRLIPEGQVFISLDNLNSGAFRELSANDMIAVLHHYKHYQHQAPSKSMSFLLSSFVLLPTSLTTSLLPENFWSLITNHWSMIKRQMEAFHQAVHAATEASGTTPTTPTSTFSFCW
ncbi:uncharacterized protein ACA1_247510 [Acanthamoeba castellanii str. Neff]|uniref:Uncharacterized protein n=1 Tax=Acanthamoeba castellanii (strain ATCC 30010 / Neff) TaxID=1257118 RepID=L8GKC1_ACACF|nr:uncharacterized protein ACA1_247510 [Acanthamoeba castellanii str. Neff]ELR13525.1 hypothetical protein ACA1_247510 [Acanthamoeba castellanii str. Neff]